MMDSSKCCAWPQRFYFSINKEGTYRNSGWGKSSLSTKAGKCETLSGCNFCVHVIISNNSNAWSLRIRETYSGLCRRRSSHPPKLHHPASSLYWSLHSTIVIWLSQLTANAVSEKLLNGTHVHFPLLDLTFRVLLYIEHISKAEIIPLGAYIPGIPSKFNRHYNKNRHQNKEDLSQRLPKNRTWKKYTGLIKGVGCGGFHHFKFLLKYDITSPAFCQLSSWTFPSILPMSPHP